MLTRSSTIKNFLKSSFNNDINVKRTNYTYLNTHRIIYYFQQDPDSQIFDQYLQNKDIALKNYSATNQSFQKIIVPRFQPKIQQIQRKLQTEWKNKKLVFNIDPSALIGSKRLFMKQHLEKNVYKGLSKPESLFSQINPSIQIATQQLKFDEDHFLYSDPIVNKFLQQNKEFSIQQQQQAVQQVLIAAYQNDPQRFGKRLKSTLNVSQPYQKIIQLAMHNQNPIYFCGINQYSLRSLLSKFLKLSQIKQLFLLSLKYAQAQSYRSILNNKLISNQNLEDKYPIYARELIYLNHFKIIKKIENGEIMKRLKFIIQEKQDVQEKTGRTKRKAVSNSIKNKNNVVLFGHSYTIQTLNDYSIIKDLESPTLQSVYLNVTPQSLNSPAPLKTTKIQQSTQSDAQKIQKHAILETMLGNLWNQPYTLNRFPYLSEDYNKLSQQDKQYVKKIYHDNLTRYTGAKRVWYDKNVNNLTNMDANSKQFKNMQFDFDKKKQQYQKNNELLKKRAQEKLKIQDQNQMINQAIINKTKLKKKTKLQQQKQAYSQYPQKYQQDQQQLKRLNIVKNPKKQQNQIKSPQKDENKLQASKIVTQQNKVQIDKQKAQQTIRTGRRIRSKKSSLQSSNQKQ